MKFRYFVKPRRLITRDNEGDDTGDTGDTADPAKSSGNADFTPEQQVKINEIVQKRVKNMRSELETSERRYEQLLSNQNLTAKERDEIAGELEQVQTQLRTKDEQTRYEAKKREAEFSQKLESTTGEAKRYRSLFESQTRESAIIAAASQHEAYNPEQFISLLSGRTEVVEEENEQGEKTGRFAPRVKVQKRDDDGKVSEIFVSPAEAIEDMKNDVEKYGNLFRGNVAKGIGKGSNASFGNNQRVDVSKMSDEEYFANRDQIRKQYGIKPRSSF